MLHFGNTPIADEEEREEGERGGEGGERGKKEGRERRRKEQTKEETTMLEGVFNWGQPRFNYTRVAVA